ncbi:GNAT family N-acetyltransferase [Bacteroidales bacterium OttesenSCG-928-B11]|nr:GNAT family N-acetyltransferase [Bacteroidales bacterium OttesenSCG-928-C03]MDL2312105.1 GNAT family N-acetyltransferase [Bacteroidales bacterium OttesenSCG-928-B11]MDL2326078.1 GNAT family N-acetyltransferase [Bacteroidales bacterium OttesenSCG-928-A14]
MKIRRITSSKDSEAQTLITLHGDIFPEYERFYKTTLWADLIDSANSMHFNAIYEDDELAGFFIYWDLEDAYYIHFIGVRPEMRNRKIGQQVLDWVATNLHKPVFLESEIPYDEITNRRLNFYKRNGLNELANDPKILSEVRNGGHPLWFMGTRQVDNLEEFLIKVRDRVYYAT